jgi:hypothetical protein
MSFGTLYTSSGKMSVSASVSLNNVTIRRPLGDGMRFFVANANPTSTVHSIFYSLKDVTVDNCGIGIYSEFMDGEIRDCTFSNIQDRTVITHNGVIDIYTSEVGEISETNLFVDEAGAIRLWFAMKVMAIWEGSGDPVLGASLELKDNSWNIIGINSITDAEGVLFSNLNSYTILPEGVFTKNPYIISVEFLGLMKEKKIDVLGYTETTIVLRDDVIPRLFIETPVDGFKQKESTVKVTGTSYDRHTGMDRVEMSIDETNWVVADGIETFDYTITDVPEGIVVIRVRAYDVSGNHKETMVTIYVDKTPPTLTVYTPVNNLMTRDRYVEIIGITDVGSDVLINNVRIELDYTLISHELPLAEGENRIRIASYDSLGNVAEVIRTVTLDTHAPYLEILTEGTEVNTARVMVKGLTEAEGVTVTVDGHVVDVDIDGRFEMEVILSDGLNNIEVHTVDEVGNERTAMLKMTLDTTPPWFKIETPEEGVIYTDKNILVKGFVELDAQVFVNERYVPTGFGQFETLVYAPEGETTISIVVIDKAGNTGEMTIDVSVDTLNPVIQVMNPIDGLTTNVPSITVNGFVTPSKENLRYLELRVAGMPWSFDKDSGEFRGELLLEEGINRITFEAVDLAGNKEVLVRTVIMDSEIPFLDVTLLGVKMDPMWNEPVAINDWVYVTGFTEIGTSLNVNGVSVKVDPETGYFNYTLALPKPISTNKVSKTAIVVTASDEAGNTATEVRDVNRLDADSGVDKDSISSSEWLVLILAIVIFGLAASGAISYQRFQVRDEIIESLESRPEARVSEGRVIDPPPKRPHRGGVARTRKVTPEESVVVDLDGELEDEEVE